MSDITRRRFLTAIGAAGTAAIAGGYGLTVWRNGASGPHGAPANSLAAGTLDGRTDRTLVIVELGGGNDGLNTVVPIDDAAYHDLRPTLGVADPIVLDGGIGLAPQLAKLAARYQDGHVAVVEGLGYPDPDLSHFASLANWWTAQPRGGDGSGWIGRYLDGTVGYDDPLAAISIGPVPSPALTGNQSFATSISDATGLRPAMPAWVDGPDDVMAAWGTFAPASPDPVALLGQVQQAIALTVEGARRARS